MRKAVLVAAAICTAVCHTPVLAEPVVLKPSSPWNVDFADNKCRLGRLFGEGEDGHLLSLEQYWPSVQAGLTIAGPALKRFRPFKDVEIAFFEGQSPQSRVALMGKVEGIGTALVISSIRLDGETQEGDGPLGPVGPDAMMAMGKKANTLLVRQGNQTVTLQTGPLGEAFKVMNSCTLDLLRGWGVDTEKYITARSGPVWSNQATLARKIAAFYPSYAAASGEQAILRMRVIVSAEGAVESCEIIEATNSKRLKSPACEIMGDAKFEPARDASGQPFRSFFATSIVYRLG